MQVLSFLALLVQSTNTDAASPTVLNLTTLVTLRLDNNRLKSLPDDLSKLVNLKAMSLEGCSRLTALPIKMGRLTNLTKLHVGGVPLITPPAVVMRWEVEDIMDYLARFDEAANNQILDLIDIGLVAVPVETFDLLDLKELNICGNKISELPPEFAKLSGLQQLNLAENNLQALPLSLVHFTKLQALDISGNGLTRLPPVVCMLSSLSELHCGGNKFTNLPPKLGCLDGLVELDLGKSKLRCPPSEVLQKGTAATLEYLARMYDSKASMTLDLSGMAIQSMPLDDIETTNLTRLSLSNNLLKNMPYEVTDMTCLTELWIDRNHLDVLPSVLGALTNLRALNLDHNNLNTLPVSIGDLVNLQVLTLLALSSTKIQILTPEALRARWSMPPTTT